MSRAGFLNVAGSLLLIVTARPTAADGLHEADRHFEAAVRLYDQGEYLAALAEFDASRRLRETASVVADIAACLHRLGRYAEALEQYHRFGELRGDGLTAPERQQLDRVTRDLAGMVAIVTARTDPPGADILVNGRPASLRGVPIDVGAEAVVEAHALGRESARTVVRPTSPGPFEVTLALPPVLRPLLHDAAPDSARSAPAPRPPVVDRHTAPRAAKRSRAGWLWWVVGGTAIVAGGAAAAVILTRSPEPPPGDLLVRGR